MPDPITDIQLSPIPGKKYFSIDREWREEFIYFLMVEQGDPELDLPLPPGDYALGRGGRSRSLV